MECEGCKRHAANPRNTLRFRAWADDCDPNGPIMHVDPSGVVYPCTNQSAPDGE